MPGGLSRLFVALIVSLVLPAPARATLRLESTWSANPVRAGKPFSLTIMAQWEGDASRYVVKPPKIELPEGIVKHAVSSSSGREGDTNHLTYRWELLANKKGHFDSIPVKVSVLEKGGKEPSEMETSTDPLVVDEARWMGIPLITILFSLAAAMLVFGGLAWIVLKRRKGASTVQPHDEEDTGLQLEALKQELNACRVRGDTLSFLKIAQEMHELARLGESSDLREISSLAERARYGSLRLSGEEMERWYQRLKKIDASGTAGSGNE